MKNLEIMARESGRENWLNETPNRGWYTCILTGKKFRGSETQAMLEDQRKYEADEEAKLMKQEIKMEQVEQKEFPEITTRNTPKPVATVQVTRLFDNKEIKAIRTEILDIRLEIEPKAKTTIIYCEDCGTAREIKVQDQFQVKRCPECQKNYRNAMRRARRRQKSVELSKMVANLFGGVDTGDDIKVMVTEKEAK